MSTGPLGLCLDTRTGHLFWQDSQPTKSEQSPSKVLGLSKCPSGLRSDWGGECKDLTTWRQCNQQFTGLCHLFNTMWCLLSLSLVNLLSNNLISDTYVYAFIPAELLLTECTNSLIGRSICYTCTSCKVTGTQLGCSTLYMQAQLNCWLHSIQPIVSADVDGPNAPSDPSFNTA